jgi:tetratricopeptide (TPR) repeat protein
VAWARHALTLGPDEIVRLGLLVLLCQAYLWRNQWAQAAEVAGEVMQLSELGSPSWAIAVAAELVDARQMHGERFSHTLDALLRAEPELDAVSTMAYALALGVYLLDSAGDFQRAELCLSRIHELVDPVAAHNPIARAWLNRAHAHREAWANEDPEAGLAFAEAARASFLEADHTRGVLLAQVFIGMNAWLLGDVERAEAELRATRAIGENLGPASSLRTLLYIEVLCDRGALDEAEREARAMLAMTQNAYLGRGRAHLALGKVLFLREDNAGAEIELRAALDALAEAPFDAAAARATLARVQLRCERPVEALANAEVAMSGLEQLGSFGFRGMTACLVYAEALIAVGNHVVAQQILQEAEQRLREQAERIEDLERRARFLHGVDEHRKLLELAKKL